MRRPAAETNSFATGLVLRQTRAPGGVGIGGLPLVRTSTLRYARSGFQFGRLSAVQLRDLLSRMLAHHIDPGDGVYIAKQHEAILRNEHASRAKGVCTQRMRETVGWAREMLGANGILLDHHIGRFVADAEALYSYEGTREMNSLIVGKAITGLSAFV